jgi:hypothetical protein
MASFRARVRGQLAKILRQDNMRPQQQQRSLRCREDLGSSPLVNLPY